MSDENSPPSSPSNRRSSFSGKLTELFGRSPPQSNGTSSTYPNAMSTVAANAQAQQRRRTSIASLAMAGSPTQGSPFTNMRNRQSSMGSTSSPTSSANESAIEEGDAEQYPTPTSPMARRTSFGVNALKDIKTQNGEGYNWSEQIKQRAERSASLTQAPPPPTSVPDAQQRTTSVAAPEQPAKELPKTLQKPDHFQERILKGDFYMD